MLNATLANDFFQTSVFDLALMGVRDALELLGIEPDDAGEFIEPTPEDRAEWWARTRDDDDKPPPDGGGGGGWVPLVPVLPWLSPVTSMTTCAF